MRRPRRPAPPAAQAGDRPPNGTTGDGVCGEAEDAARAVFDADLAEAVPAKLAELAARLFPERAPAPSRLDGEHDIVAGENVGDVVDPKH